MADKAILFDSSRCSACQACVAACKGRFGLGPASSSEDMAARAFGRAAVLDEEAPLAVARFERTLADGVGGNDGITHVALYVATGTF